MAHFKLIEKNKYKIIGVLTEEDINKINSFKNRTTLVLENTFGLSYELISKINSDRIVFSIKGGLDYDTKEKYKKQKYIDRTFVSPEGLKNIIKYFEYNENMIDPKWNEFEKAMFLYNALAVDIQYVEELKEDIILPLHVTERSLNGILYNKLTCSGLAQVYKEMLDRIGIKNYYQNQKGIHAFNIIEIDGKKYGVDVTWDNNAKKYNNGKCSFNQFGQDPEFYNHNGHHLYKDVDVSDDFEVTILERIYDEEEEIFDLSLLTPEMVKEFYTHIESKINTRKPFKYNIQNQPIEIKNQYLPIDTVQLKIKNDISKEYPIVIILEFLKKRNALQIEPTLLDAFSYRKAYLLDLGPSNADDIYNTKLSKIGINNYEINRDGSILLYDGNKIKSSCVTGVLANKSDISQEELNDVYNSLNKYLTQYFNKFILDSIKDLEILLEKYEYKPDEWDNNRAIENCDIYTKFTTIINCKDYLRHLGISENEINSIVQKITNKINETHKPYMSINNLKADDLDFLSGIFSDINLVWKTIEYDLKKKITEEEFIVLFNNVDYIIKLFEQYITIGQDIKFKFDEYNVSKEELQQLLNKIIENYQEKKEDAKSNKNQKL